MKRSIDRLLPALALALAPATLAAQTTPVDTLVSVGPNARIELHAAKGTVHVSTWDRDAVRIVASAPRAVPLRIERKGAALVVHTKDGRAVRVDYGLTAPRAADLVIHGVDSPVTIDGSNGKVEVHNVKGDVSVRGGRGRVGVHSVEGSIEITGARANVEVHSVNRPVVLRDVTGDVRVSVVNGAIECEGIDSSHVEATTVNGSIRYVGTIRPDGRYELNSHNGEIDLTLPSDASARVHVATFNGTLRAHFPVTLDEGAQGKTFDFTLGSGDARIELNSFNGEIQIRRAR